MFLHSTPKHFDITQTTFNPKKPIKFVKLFFLKNAHRNNLELFAQIKKTKIIHLIPHKLNRLPYKRHIIHKISRIYNKSVRVSTKCAINEMQFCWQIPHFYKTTELQKKLHLIFNVNGRKKWKNNKKEKLSI